MPATLTRRHMEPLEQAGSRYAELMRLALSRTKPQGPASGAQEWGPIWTAPVNTPVLVRIAGQSEPVVAICDEDRCWQVAWTGDLLSRPILWHPIPGPNGELLEEALL